MDEHSCLHVYEAETGAALWSVEGAASAAWNVRLPGMLAWCDAETLYTRMDSLPAQRHALIIQVGLSVPPPHARRAVQAGVLTAADPLHLTAACKWLHSPTSVTSGLQD